MFPILNFKDEIGNDEFVMMLMMKMWMKKLDKFVFDKKKKKKFKAFVS